MGPDGRSNPPVPSSCAVIDSPGSTAQLDRKMKVIAQHDEELVQLATRVPRHTARRLKEFCVRNDVQMQTFVRSALAEQLARARRSAHRQGSRASLEARPGERQASPISRYLHPLRRTTVPTSKTAPTASVQV